MPLTRIETSRLNGAKSRGPVTAQGRLKSSRNAVRHGITSQKMFVLQNESPGIFDQLLECCVQRFRPQDALETELVMEIAAARWRLRRLWTVETAMFDNQMDRQDEQLRKEFIDFDEATRQAEAFNALAERSGGLNLLTRYEGRLRRAYERAVNNLLELQQTRKKQICTNEPGKVAHPLPSFSSADLPNPLTSDLPVLP